MTMDRYRSKKTDESKLKAGLGIMGSFDLPVKILHPPPFIWVIISWPSDARNTSPSGLLLSVNDIGPEKKLRATPEATRVVPLQVNASLSRDRDIK